MPITPMTLGQIKQIIRRVDGSVPTDLSKDEAERIIRDYCVSDELAAFWFRVRNPSRPTKTKFAIFVDEKTMKVIEEGLIRFASQHCEDELKDLVSENTDSAWCRTEVLEVLKISGEFTSSEQVEEQIRKRGYIGAGFDELIAFAIQHDDFFSTRGHCFVHVLEQTSKGRFPYVWYDSSPKAMCSGLQLSFDDLKDGVLNQASNSSIQVLVRKI